MPLQGPDLFRLFDLMVEQNASDLHLTVGRPPVLRVRGRLRNLTIPPLTRPETTALIREIAPAGKLEGVARVQSADFGYAYLTKARFRVAIFKSKGADCMVCRLIPTKLLTFQQIGLPERIIQLLDR